MSSTRTFDNMLNEHLPNKMLREELLKRDWFLQNCNKDNNWLGGDIIVPFYGSGASSARFGGLTAAADISEYKSVRGKISAYKEIYGSLKFNHTDLMQHGKVSEQNFLRVLPDQVDWFIQYFKELLSINLLSGPHFAVALDDTDKATGTFVVDKIDRFCLDQKCYIDDSDSAELAVYVIAIDINTKEVTFSATRGGAFVDLTAYTVAAAAKFYHDGVFAAGAPTNVFNSVRDSLLSAANGGGASLHGVSKLAYPFLQAYNIDGSSWSASNFLEKSFDGYTEYRARAKAGMANKILISYKHLGSVMKLIETQKGGFKVTPGQTRVNQYGWTEIDITTVKGMLTFVGIQEMPDDLAIYLDPKAFTFRTNGFIRKRIAPDGKQFYEVRVDNDSYYYIVDIILFGELECTNPHSCAIAHSISY